MERARLCELDDGLHAELSTHDMIAGTALVPCCALELCRRTVGFGLIASSCSRCSPIRPSADLMSGPFRHGKIDYAYFLEMQTIGTDGIFGSPLYVAASYALLFILFGNFYVLSGGGQLFFDLAGGAHRAHGGRTRESLRRLVGPLRVHLGFAGGGRGDDRPGQHSDHEAGLASSAERNGAIEAAASTGGSMLPPVMGARAFIMANFTGITYNNTSASTCPRRRRSSTTSAFSPLVHFEAVRARHGLRARERHRRPAPRAHQQLAEHRPHPVVLIVLLVQGYSAAYVAAGSAVSVVISSWMRSPWRSSGRAASWKPAWIHAHVIRCRSSRRLRRLA